MEGRLAKMENKLRRITVKMKTLQCKNDTQKHWSAALGEGATPSHNKQTETESQNTDRPFVNDDKKRKMHNDLCKLMDKYA